MSLNLKKNEIQLEALQSHHSYDGYSTLCLCTGAGKTRIAVLRAIEIVKEKPHAKLFLSVPTEKLRDINWKDEFYEWGAGDIWENNLTRSCYVSVHKEQYLNQEWDLVILDEAHHITEKCIPFFIKNEIKSIIGLTATPPKDPIKKNLLNTLAPISFNYTLQQGLEDGIVAKFQFHVIWTTLDALQNVVEAGPKAKRFKTTELKSYTFWDEAFNKNKEDISLVKEQLAAYNWYELYKDEFDGKKSKGLVKGEFRETLTTDQDKLKKIKTLEGKYAGLQGSRFRIIGARKAILTNSLNKERIGRRFLNEIFEDSKRYLVFCGSIAQSERLYAGKTFHSKSNDDAYNAFMKEESNILLVKDKVNEGTNISNLDETLSLHCSAQELVLIQRVGRAIRVRDNHTGKIYIICIKGSQDEVWLKSALKGFKNIPVEYWEEKDFFEAQEIAKFAA